MKQYVFVIQYSAIQLSYSKKVLQDIRREIQFDPNQFKTITSRKYVIWFVGIGGMLDTVRVYNICPSNNQKKYLQK